ncbi:hypothetical protein GSI_11317 [Ganoderma sinense ZZ0214-1]|uniref:Uncharacterized protein n=1 Tax=Ganoderma sinense ZZ0214-1 TaxID=1077348 RepID=A0A2G8RVN0_9APHY|nr:hypothetical protein GSI_11317 [Ganoderma sinense ZZ0214-1]
MYGGLPVGTVASICSLATNLVATVLTAYKAWFGPPEVCPEPRSKRVPEEHPSREHLRAPGALYCTLWIVVVVWQTASWVSDRKLSSSFLLSLELSHKLKNESASFWFKGGVLIEGCLVPLIAIYPTAIIVLVALNK